MHPMGQRFRSGSLGAFGTEQEDDDPLCTSSAMCGLPGLAGLPLLGGRRASISQEKWVCPNDRQLALRAKLSMGWSTGQVVQAKQEALTETETKAIMDVIRKAEAIDLNEQQRVGRLVQRVEKMKAKRLGNGTSTCILCGGNLPLLRTTSLVCTDCRKGVCSKCGVEVPSGTGRDTLWLCKICSETREMWKRSGAWFFRGIPKHIVPSSERRQRAAPRRWNTLASKGPGVSTEENETSSEDELLRKSRLVKKSSSDISSEESSHYSPLSMKPSRPKGIPPVTPDVSPFSMSPRSRSVSPSPLRIDLARSKDDKIEKSPVSPANSQRDFQRTSSRESGGEPGGLLTPRYSPSPSSLSPRTEFKRDHAFDRSPSPLLKVAWRDSGRSSNSSVSESSLSCSKEDTEVESSQFLLPISPCLHRSQTGSLTSSPIVPVHVSPLSYPTAMNSSNLANISSPIVNGFRSRRGSEASRSSSEDKRNPRLAKTSALAQDSKDSNDSLISRDSLRDEATSSTDDVFQAAESAGIGGATQNSVDKRKDYLGFLDFSLLYDSHHQALHCTVHSAKDLRPPEGSGNADPYIKLHLLPGASKSNKLRTQTNPRTLNPNFNETLTYHGISDLDMAKKTLRLMVLAVSKGIRSYSSDEDRFKHDCLGEVRVPLKTLLPHESKRIQAKLDKKTSYAEDETKEIELGKILLSLKYSSQRCALLVGVVRCAHLPSMDANGFSDPYVKIHLKQAKVLQKKFKTTVKWKNLNPEFNEEFAFEMKRNEVPKKSLEIQVYDKDVGRSDDFIGGVIFSHESGGAAIRHWYDVINYPDRRHDRWHALQNLSQK